MMALTDRHTAYERLRTGDAEVESFDPDRLDGLPGPAIRLLRRAIPPGAPLTGLAELEMEGEIRLKRWTPFRATQVIRAGAGLVWSPRIDRFPISISGADTYVDGRGALDIRLWSLIPIVRADGPDIDRSSVGRLALETAAWVPQALTPQMGARWRGKTDTEAIVAIPVPNGTYQVSVAVDGEGSLRALDAERWGDPDGSFGLHSFGGTVEPGSFGGVTIAAAGRIGWHAGTERRAEGEFFRYRITSARFPTAK